MSSPFVAEIKIFAGNFAPKGYATCDGQLMPISQNTALFSLLGTFYGGDGKSTFALPNMAGSFPIGQGQGPGLSDRFLGETAGQPFVTLLQTEMPQHNHTVQTVPAHVGVLPSPAPNLAIGKTFGGNLFSTAAPPTAPMDPNALSVAGSSFPHNNVQPYLCMVFIIALQGVFPPRG